MYEAMSQDEIMHKMLAQMTILGQNMVTKSDIEGLEGRLMHKIKDETMNMKHEQDEFQGKIEARIKQLEESHVSDIKRIEQRVEASKQATGKSSSSSMNNQAPHLPSTIVEDDPDQLTRKKQILVGGINKEHDHETTITMLKELVTRILGSKAKIEVSTLTDKPGSLGTLTFQLFGDKIKFYKPLKQQHHDYEQLTFFDNLTFQERIQEKRLGLIKHFMIKSNDHKTDDIQILWRKQIVTLNNNKVAWYDTSNQINMTRAARKHQDEVENALKEWISKRSQEDPATDSD